MKKQDSKTDFSNATGDCRTCPLRATCKAMCPPLQRRLSNEAPVAMDSRESLMPSHVLVGVAENLGLRSTESLNPVEDDVMDNLAPDREKEIHKMYFNHGRTQQQIADYFNISRRMVRKTLTKMSRVS